MRARKAVITAAGRGTRMFPATRSIQKELLPLIDRDGIVKPTIQIIVEDCLAAGIEEVCIIVEKDGQGPFEQHFRAFTDEERPIFASKPALEAAGNRLGEISQRICYVEQPSPEGFGHAVYQARTFVGDEPFLLLLGDHVYTSEEGTPSCISQILDIGAKTGGSVTSVRLEPESTVSVTGVLRCHPLLIDRPVDAAGQIFDILALKEKPSIAEAQAFATTGLPTGYYLCHFGLHLFMPEIFSCLESLIAGNRRIKNEFQLTSGQELLLEGANRDGRAPYNAALLAGERWDIGMPDVYLESLIAFGRRGPYASIVASGT